MYDNTATAASEIDIEGGSSITITSSDVQGGWAGVGNIDADPQFIREPSPGTDKVWGTADDDYGDLHLGSTSLCIDAGDNSAVPTGVTTDLDGNPRFRDFPGLHDPGAIVDMGAFEASPLAGDANGDGVVNIADLYILAQNWQGDGKDFSQGDFNYDGKVDINDLKILADNWNKTLSGNTSMAPSLSPMMTALGLNSAANPSPASPPPPAAPVIVSQSTPDVAPSDPAPDLVAALTDQTSTIEAKDAAIAQTTDATPSLVQAPISPTAPPVVPAKKKIAPPKPKAKPKHVHVKIHAAIHHKKFATNVNQAPWSLQGK